MHIRNAALFGLIATLISSGGQCHCSFGWSWEQSFGFTDTLVDFAISRIDDLHTQTILVQAFTFSALLLQTDHLQTVLFSHRR